MLKNPNFLGPAGGARGLAAPCQEPHPRSRPSENGENELGDEWAVMGAMLPEFLG